MITKNVVFMLILLYSSINCNAIVLPIAKKALVPLASMISSLILSGEITIDKSIPPIQPTDKDNQLVQMAFRDFDSKRLDASEKEFTIALKRWTELHRPRDEIVSILKAR